MTAIAEGVFCPKVWLPNGWAERVAIQFDESGSIASVEPEAVAGNLPRAPGPVVPGMPNVHSHAFQRAMAGLTQHAGSDKDTFWTWRQAMYRFVDRMTPEMTEAIAGQLYVEMLEGGYTAVGEFQYLHHQSHGRPYETRSELSQRILTAAHSAGIGMTLLPVLYASGGFGGAPATEGQRRFLNDAEGIGVILAEITAACAGDPQMRIGLAPHSLRAVPPKLLREVLNMLDDIDATAPIHIHVAEQMREVEECEAWSGQRPVEWLMAHTHVSRRWCLIHATHMTPVETLALAASGAVAGLCPTTEADLGDGLFPAEDYLSEAGRFGIGSDCHTLVSATDELRMLEYGQRLTLRRRNVLRPGNVASVGRGLYTASVDGGAQALGRPIGRLSPGYRADLVVLDGSHPLLLGKCDDDIFDTYVFSGGPGLVRDVYVGGCRLVEGKRHIHRDSIARRFQEAMSEI